MYVPFSGDLRTGMEVEGRRGEGDHFATFKITLEWNGIRREQSIACTERGGEVEFEQRIA